MTAWVMQASRPAVVLGSTQDPGLLDEVRATDLGIDVVVRSSGGGAVMVVPGEYLWIDLWVPRGDPRHDNDVVRAASWVGDLWAEAAKRVLGRSVDVHTGGLRPGVHGNSICFAGTGPGEVFVDGRKLVGISQRRTRDWTRVQTLVHQRWDPAPLLELLRFNPTDREELMHELREAVAVAPGPALLRELCKVLSHSPSIHQSRGSGSQSGGGGHVHR